MKEVTISIPEEYDDAIKDELEYGDSRAGWIREAIRMRFDAEGVSVDVDGDESGNLKVEA